MSVESIIFKLKKTKNLGIFHFFFHVTKAQINVMLKNNLFSVFRSKLTL